MSESKLIVTIEDGTEIGGLGTTVKELASDKNLGDLKIKCFSYPDKFIQHGSPVELEKLYGMDVKNISNYIKYALKHKDALDNEVGDELIS